MATHLLALEANRFRSEQMWGPIASSGVNSCGKKRAPYPCECRMLTTPTRDESIPHSSLTSRATVVAKSCSAAVQRFHANLPQSKERVAAKKDIYTVLAPTSTDNDGRIK